MLLKAGCMLSEKLKIYLSQFYLLNITEDYLWRRGRWQDEIVGPFIRSGSRNLRTEDKNDEYWNRFVNETVKQ